MSRLIYRFFSVIVFCMLSIGNSYGLSLKIVDKQGKPLENTVVVLPSIAAVPNKQPLVMDQINRHFNPTVLTATAGQAVDFPNSDNVRHHVYSFSKAKPFEIKLYSGTKTSPVLFDSPGIIVLGCNIHDNMVGYILVSDGQWSAVSNSAGHVALPDGLSEAITATIWHPQMSDKGDNVQSITLTRQQLAKANYITVTIDVSPIEPKPLNSFKRRFNRG